MDKSIVLSLGTAGDANAPMVSLAAAHLVPGRGIEGDRYYHRLGTFSNGQLPAFEVTLIEADMLETLMFEARNTGITKVIRRNIVVSGSSLNTLISQPFQIGTVMLFGLAPRDAHRSPAERVVGTRLRKGIGAQILTEGIIHLGDEVRNL